MAGMTEAEARKAAEARGWQLEKGDDKTFRLVAENGTVVAGDWDKPEAGYFGLSLDDVGEALEP
jgi:hypothetical protein